MRRFLIFFFFFFNDTATTEIYTLSLHDALPICPCTPKDRASSDPAAAPGAGPPPPGRSSRSEEHTSELQSRLHLVCRLLLEKKKIQPQPTSTARTIRRPTRKRPSHVTHVSRRLP